MLIILYINIKRTRSYNLLYNWYINLYDSEQVLFDFHGKFISDTLR